MFAGELIHYIQTQLWCINEIAGGDQLDTLTAVRSRCYTPDHLPRIVVQWFSAC